MTPFAVRWLGALGFTSQETDAFRDVDPGLLQRLTDEVALHETGVSVGGSSGRTSAVFR
jgi:hypothetical protein